MTTDSHDQSKEPIPSVAVMYLRGSQFLRLADASHKVFADHEKGPDGLRLNSNKDYERTLHAPWKAEERAIPRFRSRRTTRDQEHEDRCFWWWQPDWTTFVHATKM